MPRISRQIRKGTTSLKKVPAACTNAQQLNCDSGPTPANIKTAPQYNYRCREAEFEHADALGVVRTPVIVAMSLCNAINVPYAIYGVYAMHAVHQLPTTRYVRTIKPDDGQAMNVASPVPTTEKHVTSQGLNTALTEKTRELYLYLVHTRHPCFHGVFLHCNPLFIRGVKR